MKIFLLVLFACYFSVEFVASFCAWINTKNRKDYWWRLLDTLFSAGMIVAFIKLAWILAEVE